MKSNLRILLLLSAAAVAATSVPAFAAKAEKKSPAAPSKRPTVLIDNTPVSAKPGAVASYADVVEPVQKAVVSIYSTKIVRQRIVNPFGRLFPQMPDQERESKLEGMGSGVIVSPDGYILTNNHVVEGADELKVKLTDDRDFTAKVVGADPKTDIAVIKVDASNLPVVTLADSSKLRVGDVVFAVGNPLDIGQTVTMGIISAKNRNVHILEDVGGYEDFIQTDAAINMGNSGGALIDARGRLVGINSAIISPSRGNIGIGLAVPINLAASIMNSLVETGTVARGYLGISTDNLTSDLAEQLGLPRDTRGVAISEIFPDSAAEKADLKLADVIVAFNDQPVSSWEELRLTIAQQAPGSQVKLKIMRDGKERLVDVTLGNFAGQPNELFAGVDVKPLGNEDRRRLNLSSRVSGLLITEVAADSPFRDTLPRDAVVVAINQTPVADLATAREVLHPGANLVLFSYRGRSQFVRITVE
ncbi:MAG: Do family serine endopeptidase [Opitutaceae bacterium]